MHEEIFKMIQKAISELNEENLAKLTEEVIATKVDPLEVIQNAYTPGIQEVGRLFEGGDYFLPEMRFVKALHIKYIKLYSQCYL